MASRWLEERTDLQKHKAKTCAILFRIFSKIKKAELRTYFVCSHIFSRKIQMQTNVHRAWASCGSAMWLASVSWSMLWLVTITVKSFQIFQLFTVLLVWQSSNFILNIYQLITAKSIITQINIYDRRTQQERTSQALRYLGKSALNSPRSYLEFSNHLLDGWCGKPQT